VIFIMNKDIKDFLWMTSYLICRVFTN